MSLSPERMARLLRVRRAQESLARSVWAEANREAQEEQSRAEALDDGVSTARRELSASLQGGSVQGARVEADASMIDRLADHARSQHRTAASAWTREGLARGPWNDRRQQVRGLERLQERLLERERKERLAQEASETDEIAAQRHQANDHSTRNRAQDQA